TDTNIVMVEAGAREVAESKIVEAFEFAHQAIRQLNKLQHELKARVGKPKRAFPLPQRDETLVKAITSTFGDKVKTANKIAEKKARQDGLDAVLQEAVTRFEESHPGWAKTVKQVIGEMEEREARHLIVSEQRRPDGRGFDDIRNVTAETGILRRTHGSSR